MICLMKINKSISIFLNKFGTNTHRYRSRGYKIANNILIVPISLKLVLNYNVRSLSLLVSGIGIGFLSTHIHTLVHLKGSSRVLNRRGGLSP